MKKIPLSQGQFASVDDGDYEALSVFKWHAVKIRGIFYATRGQWNPKTKDIKNLSMHRVVMNAPKGRLVDHINHDGLDNRKANLRIPPGNGRRENALNRKKELMSSNTSGFTGVCWHKQKRKWEVRMRMSGKNLYLGSFNTKKEATKAVKKIRA